MFAAPRPTIPKLRDLPLVIETHRMRLRPFTEADVDAIYPVVSQPEFPKQMSWTAHADRDETVGFVRGRQAEIDEGGGVAWAMEYEGVAVGCIGLHEIEWHLRAMRVDHGELGYWLAPAVWNKGLMTEAATAVVRYGFDTIGLHKVTTRCLADNPGSRRVIEKVGFRFVGRAEDDSFRDGHWSTHLLYELTAPEWPDVHTTMRVSRPRPT